MLMYTPTNTSKLISIASPFLNAEKLQKKYCPFDSMGPLMTS